jgi:hypothetical protein
VGRPSNPLSNYVGVYNNEDWGSLAISLDDGALRARIGDLPLPLVWFDADNFVADENHRGTVKRNAAGQVTSVLLSALLARGLVEFVRE